MSDQPQQPRRYICERCGGTGQQEAGCWDMRTRTYTSPAGVCESCNGEGLLGVIGEFVRIGKKPKGASE